MSGMTAGLAGSRRAAAEHLDGGSHFATIAQFGMWQPGRRLSVDSERESSGSDALAGFVPHLKGNVLFVAMEGGVLRHFDMPRWGLLPM